MIILKVAPYTGAWIEITTSIAGNAWDGVAPYTGAWIEMSHQSASNDEFLSHPTRVRGLK